MDLAYFAISRLDLSRTGAFMHAHDDDSTIPSISLFIPSAKTHDARSS